MSVETRKSKRRDERDEETRVRRVRLASQVEKKRLAAEKTAAAAARKAEKEKRKRALDTGGEGSTSQASKRARPGVDQPLESSAEREPQA